MAFFNKKDGFFLLIPAASAAGLAVALVAQYVFGLHPCELCQWQRVPYVLAILTGIIFRRKKRREIFLIYFLLMAVESALAFYHLAVEKGYVSSGCSDSGGGAANAKEMLDKIMAAPVVSCNQPQFEFLHLSMAGWNGIYALCLAAAAIILFKNAAR